MSQDLVQTGLWRWSRNVGTAREHWRCPCQGPAQPGARAKAEAAQGAPRPQHGNRNWNCTGLPAAPSWGSTGTAAGPCWDQSSTAAFAAAPAQLQGHIWTWFTSTKRQKHFSCTHPAFTSNCWAFQPWKINFTLFHSKLYLLDEWLQHMGAWLVGLVFFQPRD